MNDYACPVVRIVRTDSPSGFATINESDFDSKIHVKFEGEPKLALPALPAPPGPPQPADPLADLSPDWRKGDAGELRKLAASVSGRTVDNKTQAIAVIEAALAARPLPPPPL